MAQALIIQTESVLPASSKQTSTAKAKAGDEAFSAELDKQVKQSDISQSRSENAQAANTAEADKDIAADGNNLPAEANAENEQPETAEEEASSADDGEMESTETTASEHSESDDGSVVSTQTTVAPAVTAQAETAASKEKPSPAASEKPIRAQVTVSQNAVDNAKAAPVEMTAKTHPGQTVESSTPTETVTKAVTDTEKNLSSTVKTETAQPPLINKTLSEAVSSDKSATPNLAAVLKESGLEESKAPKIRADILEALQRQQNKQEVGVNLRNLVSSQVTAKADTAPAILASASALTDSSTAPVTTLTAATLTTTGSSSAQGNVLNSSMPNLPIQPGMQNPAWGQVMSSRVIWMAKEGLQQAQLRMNPANLGPVEVKLHVQNDQASVTFLAQHSATRDALEQALPRLRESFAENGMELTNAQVGEQEQQHREQSEQANESPIFTQASGQDDDIDNETVETVSSEQTSGLSLYA